MQQHLGCLDPVSDSCVRLVALDDIYEELDHRSAVAGIHADLPDEFLVQLYVLGVDVGLLRVTLTWRTTPPLDFPPARE